MADYTTLQVNITHMPTALISGLCLPKECTIENLNFLTNATTNTINSFLETLQRKYGMFNFTD